MYQSYWNTCTRCPSKIHIKKNFQLPQVTFKLYFLFSDHRLSQYVVCFYCCARCTGCSQHNAGVRGVNSETLCHLEGITLYQLLSFTRAKKLPLLTFQSIHLLSIKFKNIMPIQVTREHVFVWGYFKWKLFYCNILSSYKLFCFLHWSSVRHALWTVQAQESRKMYYATKGLFLLNRVFI
jgi:hypothetical protein